MYVHVYMYVCVYACMQAEPPLVFLLNEAMPPAAQICVSRWLNAEAAKRSGECVRLLLLYVFVCLCGEMMY